MRNNPGKVVVSNFTKWEKAMIANRSVPVNTVLPHLVYRNVAEAVAWLTRTFGFTENYRYGERSGSGHGAQIILAMRGSCCSGSANARRALVMGRRA